jgi:hypothetical protein
VHRVPSLVSAQNFLIRKLGLYVQLYKDGLTEELTKLIRELFSNSSPAAVQLVAVEEDA